MPRGTALGFACQLPSRIPAPGNDRVLAPGLTRYSCSPLTSEQFTRSCHEPAPCHRFSKPSHVPVHLEAKSSVIRRPSNSHATEQEPGAVTRNRNILLAVTRRQNRHKYACKDLKKTAHSARRRCSPDLQMQPYRVHGFTSRVRDYRLSALVPHVGRGGRPQPHYPENSGAISFRKALWAMILVIIALSAGFIAKFQIDGSLLVSFDMSGRWRSAQ